jgi:hypothetical protein
VAGIVIPPDVRLAGEALRERELTSDQLTSDQLTSDQRQQKNY